MMDLEKVSENCIIYGHTPYPTEGTMRNWPNGGHEYFCLVCGAKPV
jgi:hypothetical protein